MVGIEDIKQQLFESDMLSQDNIMTQVRLGVCRKSERNIVLRQTIFEDIYYYLYILGDGDDDSIWRILITPGFTKSVDIDENDLFAAAEENTFRDDEFVTKSLNSVLHDMMPNIEEFKYPIPIYVISNPSFQHGAVQVFNKHAFDHWCYEKGFDELMVIPSSIHEMLVLPVFDEVSISELSDMVREINELTVQPHERLGDKAYLMKIQ